MDKPHSKLDRKLKRGAKRMRHGGYSYLVQKKIPADKIYIERYLTNLREDYISDLGPDEKDLTTGQLLLLDTLITLKGVNRCIECQSGRDGDLRRLDERYNARNNQMIKICSLLGIERKEIVGDITPAEQAEIIKSELKDND